MTYEMSKKQKLKKHRVTHKINIFMNSICLNLYCKHDYFHVINKRLTQTRNIFNPTHVSNDSLFNTLYPFQHLLTHTYSLELNTRLSNLPTNVISRFNIMFTIKVATISSFVSPQTNAY